MAADTLHTPRLHTGPAPGTPGISLHGLTLAYGRRVLLRDADAVLPQGSITALIGRNGTGKSTLLRAIAGLGTATGEIRLCGKPLAALTALQRASTVSFVTTDKIRIANLACEDVVALGRAPYTNWIGRMQQADRDIVSRSLSLVGYFRAANYISACQLYLLDNPLLKRPLKASDIKKKIVGHWGTVPGQNFIYTHLDRVINKYDLDMIYISGPGHGGNFMIANTYLEGSYTEKYPNITQDEAGLQKLFKQFSFPGGVPSHVAPETPGSIHEGGELGYSLSHAFGAVFDNPNLIAACVVGDGEAETGPLATSWHGIKFLNKKTDGAVLPILHLNGYKISNPTIFSRMSNEELASFFYGCGYKAYLVEGSDELLMHKKMASTMDAVINDIKEIKKSNDDEKLRWPMIILRTPKGWTGPKKVDGKNIEGSFRAHQVPVSMDKKEHIKILEDWLRSYKPEELFVKKNICLPYLYY